MEHQSKETSILLDKVVTLNYVDQKVVFVIGC